MNSIAIELTRKQLKELKPLRDKIERLQDNTRYLIIGQLIVPAPNNLATKPYAQFGILTGNEAVRTVQTVKNKFI